MAVNVVKKVVLKRPAGGKAASKRTAHVEEDKGRAKKLIIEAILNNGSDLAIEKIQTDLTSKGFNVTRPYVAKVLSEYNEYKEQMRRKDFIIGESWMLESYDEGFILCMVLRQIQTVASRNRMGVPVVKWSDKRVFFTRHISPSIAEIVTHYDIEEPIPDNSEWLKERLGLIANVTNGLEGAQSHAHFLFSLLIFHTGSDEVIKLVKKNVEVVKRNLTKVASEKISI